MVIQPCPLLRSLQYFSFCATLTLMDVKFLTYLALFLFGLNIGSFLNVLIDRLPRGEQVLKGRSYCDRCKHKLAWYDLVPIISWLTLGGRCRHCHSPISGYYPTVELLTGVLFVFVSIHLRGVSPASNAGLLHLEGVSAFLPLAYYFFIISVLIVVFFADLKYQIIPDQVVYPAIVISLFFSILQLPPPSRSPYVHLEGVLTALGAGLFFLAVVLATRGRGMGVGDVKLAALMGLILGFPKIIIALYLAFLTGAAIGVILILTGKKRFGQHIPFGPFLVISTLVALFGGDSIWQIWGKIF